MKIYRPCPKCSSENTRVTCTEQKVSDKIKRYLRCLDCHFRFRSTEIITDEMVNKGRVKGSFLLDAHQIRTIVYNDANLTYEQWAEIYNVSTATIRKAKLKFAKETSLRYYPHLTEEQLNNSATTFYNSNEKVELISK